METNTKLEKQTIERLIKECDLPVQINYDYDTEQFAVFKEKTCEFEVDIYGSGKSFFDALLDFAQNYNLYYQFSEANWSSAERFVGDVTKDEPDILDELKKLTEEEQI